MVATKYSQQFPAVCSTLPQSATKDKCHNRAQEIAAGRLYHQRIYRFFENPCKVDRPVQKGLARCSASPHRTYRQLTAARRQLTVLFTQCLLSSLISLSELGVGKGVFWRRGLCKKIYFPGILWTSRDSKEPGQPAGSGKTRRIPSRKKFYTPPPSFLAMRQI